MNIQPDTPFFFAGEQIAGFQLLRPLRVRKLSECWYACCRRDGTPAAIKFLRQEHPRIPQFYTMAEFLKNNSGTFLIRVYDYGKTVSGLPYAVMEYAGGGTLRQRLNKYGTLSLPEAVRLLREMLCALELLHSRGIIHRDIKPENIWITDDNDFRLGDFGIVRLPGCPEEPGKIFGTPYCMPPEQAKNSASIDGRGDLYSLAVVLFEALTGERLRPKGSFTEIVKFILTDRTPPPLNQLKDAATEKLALLLGRMLERSPALRPQNATEVLAELDRMMLPDCD